ncbi:hypothetical protein GCM10009637_17510 [Brevibacterium luteolum]
MTQDADRTFSDVLQDCHVREQVELLKHHADSGAPPCQFSRRELMQSIPFDRVAYVLTLNQDPPAIRLLQQIDATQEGGFSRPRTEWR